VRASRLPLSIVVVGIGGEDFSNMEGLGGSNLGSRAAGYVERDVVQFSSFAEASHDGGALAARLLAELPGQFLAYMRCGSRPGKPGCMAVCASRCFEG
jgi:hypothetical protein